jgi:hypothetical protein
MDKLLKTLKRITFLPIPLTMLISLPSFCFVIYSLSDSDGSEVLDYISYALSAYALIITSTAIYRIIKWSRTTLKDNALWQRYRRDISLRMKMSLLPGAVMNVVYVAVNLYSGVKFRSFWFVSIAVYYAVLLIMRFSLFGHILKNEIGSDKIRELRKALSCGYLLLVMDLVLALMVFFMVYWNRGYVYHGIFIYVMASYTLYSVTAAIVNLIKYRKFGSPVVLTTKVLSLTAALVSLLSLEGAMLSEFGQGDMDFNRLMIGLTGAGVCLIVHVMAISMIIRSNRQLSKQES